MTNSTGFFAKLFVFRVALAPFLDAELQIVIILFGEDGALALRAVSRELAASGKNGMLDDVLMDRLDERVVGDRLDEDRAVVVPRRGGHVNLKRKPPILLQHAVMDVLDRLEPGHAFVVDVVRLVVEHREFVDFADDLAEVGLAVRRLADRLGRQRRREEVVAQVVVFKRGFADVAEDRRDGCS